MTSLISAVSLSKKQPQVGESVRVQVKTSDPTVDVMINGVYGVAQYLQFAEEGKYTVVISALHGKDVEQAGEMIKVRRRREDAHAFSLIWATQDRYEARAVVFTVPNASPDFADARSFTWHFGDGTSGNRRHGVMSDDYTLALARDRLYTTFDVQPDATVADGTVSTGRLTISLSTPTH